VSGPAGYGEVTCGLASPMQSMVYNKERNYDIAAADDPDAMPEELTYDSSAGLIRIRAWGDETILDWTESKREIMRLHKKYNASRLFVDAREMLAAPSVLDILDFGDTWPQDVRAAILIGKSTPEDVMFLDATATFRHKPMRIFYDEKEAMNYLRQPT